MPIRKNYGIMMTSKTEREVEGMCNLSQIHVDAGRREGLAEGMIKNVMTIMKKTNQTLNQAMDLLDIDESLRPEISEFIKT